MRRFVHGADVLDRLSFAQIDSYQRHMLTSGSGTVNEQFGVSKLTRSLTWGEPVCGLRFFVMVFDYGFCELYGLGKRANHRVRKLRS
jgi:hypothetical protein